MTEPPPASAASGTPAPRVVVATVYLIECEWCGKVGQSRDPHLAYERMKEHTDEHA